MIKQSLRLGTIWGIPIGINNSWLLVFVLLTLSLAGHFGALHPYWAPAYHYTLAVVTSLLFFTSVLLHELGHSAVALQKHVPIRSITLFVFGGVAQLGKEPDRPLTELHIAIAGPLVSLGLWAVYGLLSASIQGVSIGVHDAMSWLSRINLNLALFNLLPGFPLDGGRVFRALVWQRTGDFSRATRVASDMGRGVAYLFIMTGAVIALRGALFDGLWISFIGWFLLSAAESSVQQLALRHALAGLQAKDVMTTECPQVSEQVTVEQLVQDSILATGRRCFVVTRADKLVGLITVHQVKSLPRTAWAHTSMREAMIPLADLQWVAPEADVIETLTLMDEKNIGQVPVIQNGRFLGLVGRDHLLRVIRARLEFPA